MRITEKAGAALRAAAGVLILLSLAQPSLEAQSRDFAAKTFRSQRGATTPYRLFIPRDYDPARTYPLVLWLHGSGDRGNDNELQIREGNSVGATVWTTALSQAANPAFVLAPQCPPGETWTSIGADVTATARLRDVVELLEEVRRTYSIDPRRLYVAGQSMGGFAVWALLTDYPRMFAAGVAVCGGGDETKAGRLVRTPIWAFHGERDQAVIVYRSRRMVNAIHLAGGRRARLTEYRGEGHAIWNRAFADAELLEWVFAQRRR